MGMDPFVQGVNQRPAFGPPGEGAWSAEGAASQILVATHPRSTGDLCPAGARHSLTSPRRIGPEGFR